MRSIQEILSSQVVRLGADDAWDGIHLVDSTHTAADVLRCLTTGKGRQIVIEEGPFFEDELQSSAQMLASKDSLFDHPLCTILTPQLVSQEQESKLVNFEAQFSTSATKKQILDQMCEFLKQSKISKSVSDDIRLVSDELITNAVYNAPFAKRNLKIDRLQTVSFEEGLVAKIKVSRVSDRVVVVCEDPFGSLEIQAFLERILKCYETNPSQCISWSTGGAGIGSYLIFETCISLYVGVMANRQTVFGCVFPVDRSERRQRRKSRGVHFVSC